MLYRLILEQLAYRLRKRKVWASRKRGHRCAAVVCPERLPQIAWH
jgi:hypothetical protein